MVVDFSSRPKGMKPGVTRKKIHQALGFDGEVGTADIVLQLDLTALNRAEGVFLRDLVDGIVRGGIVAIFDKDGKLINERRSGGLQVDESSVENPSDLTDTSDLDTH